MSLLSISVLSQADAPKIPTPKADIYIIPAAQNLPITLKYPAEIKSFQHVSVVSRVLGILEKKHFTEGQKVKAGDLLYKIEDDIYVAKVDAAKASVQMTQASLENATKNWDRTKKLFLSKAVSEEKRDESFSAYEQAAAAFSLAKAQLRQASIDLEYTNVKAPIGGTVGLKQVDIGDLVSSNPPTKLVDITNNNPLYVEFSMPFSDYKNIKNNIWSMPEKGTLNVTLEIDNQLSSKVGHVNFMEVNVNKATATVQMRALVENSDEYLMSGSFVRVVINDIVQKNVITIPQKAVLQNPLGTIVFVEDNGHVGVKPIVIGNETDDKYIVKGGPLQSGDKVIINNFFRLKPGAEVVVDKIVNQQGK
jgi:membrane fusion protein (multidrug efflux system)